MKICLLAYLLIQIVDGSIIVGTRSAEHKERVLNLKEDVKNIVANIINLAYKMNITDEEIPIINDGKGTNGLVIKSKEPNNSNNMFRVYMHENTPRISSPEANIEEKDLFGSLFPPEMQEPIDISSKEFIIVSFRGMNRHINYNDDFMVEVTDGCYDSHKVDIKMFLEKSIIRYIQKINAVFNDIMDLKPDITDLVGFYNGLIPGSKSKVNLDQPKSNTVTFELLFDEKNPSTKLNVTLVINPEATTESIKDKSDWGIVMVIESMYLRQVEVFKTTDKELVIGSLQKRINTYRNLLMHYFKNFDSDENGNSDADNLGLKAIDKLYPNIKLDICNSNPIINKNGQQPSLINILPSSDDSIIIGKFIIALKVHADSIEAKKIPKEIENDQDVNVPYVKITMTLSSPVDVKPPGKPADFNVTRLFPKDSQFSTCFLIKYFIIDMFLNIYEIMAQNKNGLFSTFPRPNIGSVTTPLISKSKDYVTWQNKIGSADGRVYEQDSYGTINHYVRNSSLAQKSPVKFETTNYFMSYAETRGFEYKLTKFQTLNENNATKSENILFNSQSGYMDYVLVEAKSRKLEGSPPKLVLRRRNLKSNDTPHQNMRDVINGMRRPLAYSMPFAMRSKVLSIPSVKRRAPGLRNDDADVIESNQEGLSKVAVDSNIPIQDIVERHRLNEDVKHLTIL